MSRGKMVCKIDEKELICQYEPEKISGKELGIIFGSIFGGLLLIVIIAALVYKFLD